MERFARLQRATAELAYRPDETNYTLGLARAAREAFIRGDDNETLVGTENLTKAQLKKMASTPVRAAAKKAAAAAR